MGFQQNPDYITVAERIVEFRNKHPQGTLRPWVQDKPYTIEEINGTPCFVVVAAAYRAPDDTMPGIGMAYEPIPGSTPYTRGSELQNAETAAWGRAIVAALAADTNRGIASREEIDAQQARANQAQQQAQAQPARQDDGWEDVLASWQAAIEERKGNRDELLALYNQARAQRAPQQILDLIRAAGDAARAAAGNG